MTRHHRGSRFWHALSQLTSNTNFQPYCSLHQTLAPLSETVLMGINKWHNADSLAMTAVLVAATVEAVMALMAAAAVVVAMVVVVPAAAAAVAVPVELSLHSQMLTFSNICKPTATVNYNNKKHTCQTHQRGYKHPTVIHKQTH
jgi:hypothetical protein